MRICCVSFYIDVNCIYLGFGLLVGQNKTFDNITLNFEKLWSDILEMINQKNQENILQMKVEIDFLLLAFPNGTVVGTIGAKTTRMLKFSSVTTNKIMSLFIFLVYNGDMTWQKEWVQAASLNGSLLSLPFPGRFRALLKTELQSESEANKKPSKLWWC